MTTATAQQEVRTHTENQGPEGKTLSREIRFIRDWLMNQPVEVKLVIAGLNECQRNDRSEVRDMWNEVVDHCYGVVSDAVTSDADTFTGEDQVVAGFVVGMGLGLNG